MSDPVVNVHREGYVAVLELNRPQSKNSCAAMTTFAPW